MTSSQPFHNAVFSIPRTASHLLVKLLNLPGQDSLLRAPNDKDGYLFLDAAVPRFRHGLVGKPLSSWSDEEKTALKTSMQSCLDSWVRLLDSAESQGKGTFLKEHVHWMVDPLVEPHFFGHAEAASPPDLDFSFASTVSTSLDAPSNSLNITCMPDEFLLQRVKPTFLIRHPALAFPSLLRTALDGQSASAVAQEVHLQQWESTYYWSLRLYKFYVQSASSSARASRVEGIQYPIVLDASDLGDQALVRRYAEAMGLDPEKVRFEWEKAGEEERSSLSRMEKRMKSTILASSGVEKGKLSVVDVDMVELGKAWKEEFGEELGARMLGFVERGMGDYEELRSFRLTL